MYNAKEINQIAKEFGGEKEGNKIYFSLDTKASNDEGENITNPKALVIEKKMMEAGTDGALIGGVFDEGDEYSIYFNIK